MAIGTGLLLAGASAVGGIASASAAKKAGKDQRAAADAATKLQRDQFEQTTENFAPFLGAGRDAMAAYLYEMGLGPKPTFGGTPAAIETFTVPGTGSQNGPFGINRNVRPASRDRAGFGMSSGGRPQGLSRGDDKGAASQTRYRVGSNEFATLSEAEEFAKKNHVGGTEYGGYSTSPMARYLLEKGKEGIQGAAAAAGGLFSGATLEALEADRRRVIGADTADYFSRLTGLTSMGLGAAGNQANAGQAFAGNVGNLQMNAAQASGNARLGAASAFNNTLGDMAGIAGYFSNPMAAYAAPTMRSSPRPVANPRY